MSDVFLSYSHLDKDSAERIAKAFQYRGWSVFWDKDIPPGKTYDHFINEHLQKALCVVVLWSASSVTSDWVKEEAQQGMKRGKLVPILIEQVAPPLGFGRIEAAELYDWHGEAEHPEYKNLVNAVESFLQPPQNPAIPPPPARYASIAAPGDRTPSSPVIPHVAQNITPTHLPPRSSGGVVLPGSTGKWVVLGLVGSGTMIALITLINKNDRGNVIPPPPVITTSPPPVVPVPAPTQVAADQPEPTPSTQMPEPVPETPPVVKQPEITPTDNLTPNPSPRLEPSGNGVVTGEPGSKNVRGGPGTNYPVIGSISTGERVMVVGSSFDTGGFKWYQIRHPLSGSTGWIAAQLLDID